MVLASAVWSTEAAVIISPDATTELELADCAVVLEHPASSTAAAAAAIAANHAPEPPRIRENFDLMLSPLTGTEARHFFDRLRWNDFESSRHSKALLDGTACPGHFGWPVCSIAHTSFRHLRVRYWHVGWHSSDR